MSTILISVRWFYIFNLWLLPTLTLTWAVRLLINYTQITFRDKNETRLLYNNIMLTNFIFCLASKLYLLFCFSNPLVEERQSNFQLLLLESTSPQQKCNERRLKAVDDLKSVFIVKETQRIMTDCIVTFVKELVTSRAYQCHPFHWKGIGMKTKIKKQPILVDSWCWIVCFFQRFWDVICSACGTQNGASGSSGRTKVFSCRRSITSWSDVAHLVLSCLGTQNPGERFFDLEQQVIPFIADCLDKLHLPRAVRN